MHEQYEKCKHGEMLWMGCVKCATEACDHALREMHQPGCDCALCRSADAAEAANSTKQ